MTEKVIRILATEMDEWVEAQKRKYLDARHYDRLISRERTTVLKPSGDPLLLYRPRALPLDVCELARPALRVIGGGKGEHRKVYGRIAGYYDDPVCRLTHFTKSDLRRWVSVLPFIRAVSGVFRRELPSRYVPQRILAGQTDPRFVIGGTCFTTMTVNLWNEMKSARTPVHKDDGDLKEGFGVISVLSKGEYSGGELIFPQYRIAVDLRTTDVLLCDVHEFHGNAPIIGSPGWERIATVLYYRTQMQRCAKALP